MALDRGTCHLSTGWCVRIRSVDRDRFCFGEREATAILVTVGTAVGLLLVVLGIPGLVAGAGLLARKSWARILAIVVGILGLVNIPIGTAIGVYTLYVLMQDAATEYFAPQASA